MKRVVPWMLLAAVIGCQGSEPAGRPDGASSSPAESGVVNGTDSERPPILFASDEEPVDTFAERAAEVKTRFTETQIIGCLREAEAQAGSNIGGYVNRRSLISS